jgi:thymidylate synthase (FAD)
MEDLVTDCARVSNPKNQGTPGDKLLKYLIKEGHWSPFEMVSVCLEIVTTRDIARQMLRHRSFSFQEFSQRYADPTSGLSFETRDARLQDEKNRQNSIECEDSNLDIEWQLKQAMIIDAADDAYRWARSRNIAKEQARAILPEGCTRSRLYMNGTLRSWIHYIQLRTGNGTQKEHIEVAKLCKEALEEVFPLIKELA